MNRAACVLVLCAAVALSACGTLSRIRSRRPAVADSTLTPTGPVPDSALVRADTPHVPGPFADTLVSGTPPGSGQAATDSNEAAPWWMRRPSYNTFSGKAKGRFESPEESRDFTLTVRIEHGARIWMSVVGSAMGISMEAFRALLTPDSMIAINRIDREVIRAPFAEIGNLFPVQGDFHMMEAILVGNSVAGAAALSEQPRDTADASVILAGEGDGGGQLLVFRPADSLMSRQVLWGPDSRTTLSYDDYRKSGQQHFAVKRRLTVERVTGAQEMTLEFTSFSFDEPVDMTISIPPKYKER